MKGTFTIILLFLSFTASSETVWSKVGKEYSLDPVLLYAVALKESRRWNGKSSSSPWPWTLNIGKGMRFDTKEDAHAELSKQIGLGKKNIDVGMMQVNLIYNGHRVSKPSDLLDPETNIRVAAQILSENIRNSKGDIYLAVGSYYSRIPSRSKAYAEHVLAMVSKMKDTEVERILNN